MLVGDFKIFLIELIAIIIISVIAYHVFDCVAGFTLQILMIAATAISVVFFSVWTWLSIGDGASLYIFWLDVGLVLFALLALLSWEYPLEVVGIRIMMMVFGLYYLNSNSDAYGVSMVFAVQYVLFALFILGSIASFMDD